MTVKRCMHKRAMGQMLRIHKTMSVDRCRSLLSLTGIQKVNIEGDETRGAEAYSGELDC